jgi:hypothetical protein
MFPTIRTARVFPIARRTGAIPTTAERLRCIPGIIPSSGDDINAANNSSLMMVMKASLPDALDTYTATLRNRPATLTLVTNPGDATVLTANRNSSGMGITASSWTSAFGIQRAVQRAGMFTFELVAAGTGAMTPNWLTVDLTLTTHEPAPQFTSAPSLFNIDLPWPFATIDASAQSADAATCHGLIMTDGGGGATTDEADVVSAFGTYMGGFPGVTSTSILGRAIPTQGLAQLSLLDLGYYRDGTENEIQVANADCAFFVLQAVQHNRTGYTTSGQFAAIGPTPVLGHTFRIHDLGAWISVPGGWHTIPRLFGDAAVTSLSVGNRVLRKAELGMQELQSPVVRIPNGTRFLILRSWCSVTYGSNRSLMSKLGLSVW